MVWVVGGGGGGGRGRVRSGEWGVSERVSESIEAITLARVPSQPGPEKASALSLSVILARHWALQVVRQVGRSLFLHEISYCLLLIALALPLLCSLLS